MPAQWPSFINRVSSKLISRSLSAERAGGDVQQYTLEIAELFANEYHKAVKTAQTPFGNIHNSGSKSILDAGFKQAFGKLFESVNPQLEDKFEDPLYSDMEEGLPVPDYSFDPLCEIEKWTMENTDRLTKFTYFPLFPSTCPLPEENGSTVDGEIQVTEPVNLAEEEALAKERALYVTMSISGYDKTGSYLFKYSINGEIQEDVAPSKNGSIELLAPLVPGEYVWNFISVHNAADGQIIKSINKSKIFSIASTGEVTLPEESDEAYVKPLRKLVPEMTNEERDDYLSKRILLQNDNTENFNWYVENFKYYARYNAVVLSVWNKVNSLVEAERNRLEAIRKKKEDRLQARIDRIYTNTNTKKYLKDRLKRLKKKNRKEKDKFEKIIPPIPGLEDDLGLNKYVFQEEHADKRDDIPSFVNNTFITTLTYDPSVDTKPFNNASRNHYTELSRKKQRYNSEKNKWHDLLRKWGNEQKENNKGEDDIADEKDPYDIMAETIFAYWLSTGPQPFKAPPPVPPCNIPSPGTFIPVYYGSQRALANDLRRAWNMGKRTSTQPGLQASSRAVASAVAASCAKHLLQFKFIYVGQLFVGTGSVPMIGFVPTTF